MRKSAWVLAVVAGVALAGCGGDGAGGGGGSGSNGVVDMAADEILAELQDAATAADSVRLSGRFADGEQEFDLDMTYGPDSVAGTIGSEGFEFEFLVTGGDTYMKASAETWDEFGGDGLGQLLGDSYVLVPADDPSFGEMTEILDRDAFVSEVFSDIEGSGETTKGDESEIDGQPVLGLNGKDGAVLYVATTGDPLPVQMTAPEGETGMFEFEWNIDVDITAPDEADIVDLNDPR